jgi:acyl-CoA reductase-like NAD-dependent aldehyde dehydrogenase
MKFNLKIKNANPTGEFKPVKSPYDGRLIGEYEVPDDSGIEQAFKNAEELFNSKMRKMPAHERAEILYKVAKLMKEEHEFLSQLIASEGGKPLRDARAEVTRAIDTVKMSGDEALTLNGEQITMDRSAKGAGHLAFTIRQPLGVVLAISAFNHPVNLIAHQVATAFAAGNTVLVKPASSTALSCLKMIELFEKAGLEEGIINGLTVSGSKMSKLVSDPRIRFITFIGSEAVGWELRKKIAPGCGLALEHGGTAAAIVDKSAKIDETVPGLVKSAMYHAGQVCVSTQNVFLHEDIYDTVSEMLVDSCKKLVTGDPNDENTDVGPIIDKSEHQRLLDWIDEAKSLGGEVLLGGNALPNNCIEPTILTNVNFEMKAVHSEIFGPVINLLKYRELDKVIHKLNKTNYSFQTAIYTQDIDLAFKYARDVDSKAVLINEMTAFRVDWMPFGGSKHSGLSVGGMKYSIEDMTEEKLIIIKNRL